MKKLFVTLFLGLLLCNLSYANTPVQQYVFEKLYDEYSKCTVYYKFLSRGVERKKDVAALSEKEELFVKEMNILSEEAEKNMYFFSSKINVPNENIQSNIQNIYKTFLDIAGRDYSKTELLNDKYYTLCSNSLKDPESRMVFFDNLYKNSKKDKNVIGIKLFCPHELNSHQKPIRKNFKAYEFKSENSVLIYSLSELKIRSMHSSYKIYPEKIKIRNGKTIMRDTLELKGGLTGFTCEILDSSINLDELINSTLKKILEEQKNLNKI